MCFPEGRRYLNIFIYILFVLYTTHAEAVGAIAAVRRVDVARVEVEDARVVVASVVRRRGPIVAVRARAGQLAAIAVEQARSREKQRALVIRVVITPEPTDLAASIASCHV